MCYIAGMKDQQYFIQKNIYLLYSHKRVEMSESDREMKDLDCYDWHHFFLTYAVILYLDPHLEVLLLLSWRAEGSI